MARVKLNIMDVRLFKIAISFLFVLFISACSGGTDSTLTNTDETIVSASLLLTVLDDDDNAVTTLTQGDSATIRIYISNDENSAAIQGAEIEFTTSSGSISPTTILTDADGVAEVIFNSTDSIEGVISISATSTINDLTFASNIVKFNVDSLSTTIESASLDLSATDKSDNEFITLTKGDIATFKVYLSDDANNNPIADTEIVFTTSSGAISPASILTNNDGIAEVIFNSTDADIGVISISAATSINGNEFNSNVIKFNVHEVNTSIDNAFITLTATNDNEDEFTTLTKDENATFTAMVTNGLDNSPIAGVEVTFTTTSGVITPTSKLTDENGLAQVTFNPTEADIGVTSVTASSIIDGSEFSSNTVKFNVANRATTVESATLALSATDKSDNEFITLTKGDSATFTINVSDNENPISGAEVAFTTTSGEISPTSKLTDENGLAQVTYNSTDADIGVTSVTAISTINGTEFSSNTVKFNVANTAETVENATLSLSATNKDGVAVTSITASDSLTLTAHLKDADDVALVGETITYATTSGTLSTTSRLTDTEGNSKTILTTSDDDVGVLTITASVIIEDKTFNDTIKIDVFSQTINEDIESFDFGGFTDDIFTSGVLSADSNLLIDDVTTIGAGSSFGVNVSIVDQDLNPVTTTPFEVNFTSTCVTAGKATIDATVFSIKGKASATYQDINCAGPDGNEDNIVATVTIDSTQYIASRNILLQPEGLGSIEFVSASPESIVLKGVGGQNNQESSTLTFLVKGQLGNPQSQKEVSFELSTLIGGIALISDSGTTNADGLVTASVIAGNVPTAVRVTATVTNEDKSISTQSDLLSVNTGLPDQNSMTLAFSLFNPEAKDYAGEEVTVTAYLADSFNNPVPDGTTINFTTEGGAIEPTCNTESGSCSVLWNSQHPHADNHRVTVLATAIGHEYFVDVDGNNYYSDTDGIGVSASDKIASGFDGISQQLSGFIDMPEAWRDDNENYQYDLGEQFLDDDNLGTFTVTDGLFNGPQCNATQCSNNSFITIRKAGVIITSGSKPYFIIENKNTGEIYYDGFGAATLSPIPASTDILIKISDSQRQTLPANTRIYVNTSGFAEEEEEPDYIIGNTIGTSDPSAFGGITVSFNTGTDPINYGILVITPKLVTTSILFN
ncbi:Ig-like domain-containing protein [Psychrosphaera aquimarina]|uniref:Ig-like domain-containing protein n=1 Tax=Psychrosphaera aquimarina TaxID=2044854 RepID=A0ABU3R3M0_9GAMM|nr:Ig-like domain-containing protein [Psychrosphaera aquimarina]MDU0113888.1 Ig-like domain-containing protein [Psychrosphaera aquimarina]